MTRGQEVEGELVQDHHPQDKVTASGSQQTEVRGGGNYRGHRHLPARGPHGIGPHVTATDTYLHLEMTVIRDRNRDRDSDRGGRDDKSGGHGASS